MKPSEVIREAKNVLFERGWTQGRSERADGSVCLVGALNVGMGESARRSCMATHVPAIDDVMKAALDGCGTAFWNDYPNRTFDEVIDGLDRAEKIAEQREVGQ